MMKKPIQLLVNYTNHTNHLTKIFIGISLVCLSISLPASAEASFWHSQVGDTTAPSIENDLDKISTTNQWINVASCKPGSTDPHGCDTLLG